MSNEKSKDKGSLIGKMTVSGGQVNIVGEGTMNQYYSSAPNSEVSMSDLIKLLRQIDNLLTKENIDKDTKQTARGDLRSALEQAQKEQPKKDLIINRLKSVSDLLMSLGGAVSAGQTIYPLLQQALEFAQKILVK